MDGWLHNDAQPRANPLEPALPLPGATNNKKTPAARSIAVRGTVEYKPTSDFSASLKLLYSDYRDNELSGQVQAVRCGGRDHPTTLGQVSSEERRIGKGCVSTCISRGSRVPSKKNQKNNN